MIEVSGLSKHFGRLAAVAQLSFHVAAGEAVALWGANGAGKTTVLRCLLGLIPFTGDVTIANHNVAKRGKAARRMVGFVPQDLTFHDDLTVAETLTFYGRLKKVSADFDFTTLLAQLQLQPHIDKRVGDLSGGLKQRLALALALLADPPILLLDEPSASLDIRARDDFLHLLNGLKTAGKTFVFSSHRLDEVTALADRVLLLEAGKLVVDAPPSELEQRLGLPSTLHLYMPKPTAITALETLTAQGLAVHLNGRGVRVQVAAGEKGRVLRLLHNSGIEIDDFVVE